MNNDMITNHDKVLLPETPDVPVEHLENTEKVSVKETENKSKSDKRLEKLNALKDKYAKAVSAQECAEKKTQNISSQIEKIEKELHAEEEAELYKACEAKKLSYREIARFLMSIPEDMTLTDIQNMLS